MIFKRKIPCYVLLFEQVAIIERTLKFLSQYADQIDLILVENPSATSPQIKLIVEDYGKRGLVKRYYQLDENVTGNALGIVIEKERDIIHKSKYVIVTDGDIESNNHEWLKEQKNILKNNSDVFSCGISLDMSNLPLKTFPEAKNWIPPDESEQPDYFEVYTGVHLLLMRSKELLSFMDWKNQEDLAFVDGNLHKYCTSVLHKKWARTKNTKAIHLTWDLYHDRNHPYTKFKLSKSFQSTWYHQKTSDFTLTKY